jgi:hydroxymethylglutaryl-CoA reductase (NADPH)
VSSWANPFNLTEQPSEATLNLISNNLSSNHPHIISITLSILPPVFFRSVSVHVGTEGFLKRSERAVGGFLEGWTERVGDPVMSKWIIVILCVSMGLNAWLLNAASRNAMQPLYPQQQPNPVDKTSPQQPTISVTNDNKAAKPTGLFSLDESESDDDEKHLSIIKKSSRRVRSVSECMQILNEGRPQELLDEEVIGLAIQKKIPLYALERTLKDLERAVKIRRAAVCIPYYCSC